MGNAKIKIPAIKTDRLLLRPIVKSDIDNIYNGLSNPEVIKYYGVSFDSLEATKEQMEWFEKSSQCWWAICSLDNKQFYGAAGVNDISLPHKKAEIGFWLLPDYWREGIISEAIPLVINFGFNQLELHRIEGFVETENQGSKHTLEKVGFRYEGTMNDCEIKNGKYISIDIYAILNQSQKVVDKEK
ncbi:GNAT family N-acetyltransferase [Fulvivirga lutimaris]|uniref:GNAT family N-acetyltransferase n=1 Tax=Fulvivirga lutimaris TaxID=1819566 RepID=UPI0012BC580E|nr:GNAT family protein [Fulvivirga lutimaris]MTI38082.1 N-acetyltransferase [Fulvivirga lutimaris]